MKAKIAILVLVVVTVVIVVSAQAFTLAGRGAAVQLCPVEGKGDPNLTTVLIKVVLMDGRLKAIPERCEVYGGTEVIWSPDSNTKVVWARFGAKASGLTINDKTASDSGAFLLFGEATNGGGALPFSVRARKDRPDIYTYFLSANGTMWEPNPAIIIKPDRLSDADK
jgi:hypothetical protein